MKILLLICVLAFCAFGQSELHTDYDKFKDETKVLSYLSHSNKDLTVMLVAAFPGQKISTPKQIFMFFRASRTSCRGLCFSEPSLIFLLGDQRIHMGTKKNTFGESVLYVLTPDLLEQMTTAKSLEFQIGSFEGSFDNNALATIRAFTDYFAKTK